MKWFKENWLLAIAFFALFILLISAIKSCGGAFPVDKEQLRETEIKITELDKAMRTYEAVAIKATKNAQEYAKRAKERESEVRKSEAIIRQLRKERATVNQSVANLPPSALVKESRLILNCAQVELKQDGILFPVKCVRTMLTKLKEFSLIKEELTETQFALSESIEATKMHERMVWEVYGICAALGNQVLTIREIVKAKDIKYGLLEKSKAKSYYTGLWKGVLWGIVIITAAKLTYEVVR